VNNRFFDIVVAKEYEIRSNGIAEKRTAWNRVGRAWPSKSGESLSFELFLLPNQRYVLQLSDKNAPREPVVEQPNISEVKENE